MSATPRRPILIALAIALGAVCMALWRLNHLDEAAPAARPPSGGQPSSQAIARGAYLALAGNCGGCHHSDGHADYAGGKGIATPFGTVYAPNLTPHPQDGLGAWTADDFWRALHNGRSRDGHLLYPAFPYPNYTRISRADSDALFAYLHSLPAVAQANRPHALRFPFDLQLTLSVWRALYFRPYPAHAGHDADDGRDRGAYLVEGLGHCNACHAARNALGAASDTLDLAGGLIPVQNWYAPSLTSASEAGMADWDVPSIVELLRSGISGQAMVSGPMSEVVMGSTQYLTPADLTAMAIYLKSLPQTANTPVPRPVGSDATAAGAGAKLYTRHCQDCHGPSGEGVPHAYPALARSRTVNMPTPANLIHIVKEGGFAPATRDNPRPFGMPPFATILSDGEIAQVLTWIRQQWENSAPPVTPLDVKEFSGPS